MNIYNLTTPFGLLDPETQKALRNHPGRIEFFKNNGWTLVEDPQFYPMYTYRARPLPREWWLVLLEEGGVYIACTSRAAAEKYIAGYRDRTVVHVREVQK